MKRYDFVYHEEYGGGIVIYVGEKNSFYAYVAFLADKKGCFDEDAKLVSTSSIAVVPASHFSVFPIVRRGFSFKEEMAQLESIFKRLKYDDELREEIGKLMRVIYPPLYRGLRVANGS